MRGVERRGVERRGVERRGEERRGAERRCKENRGEQMRAKEIWGDDGSREERREVGRSGAEKTIVFRDMGG